ncbi:hypothetical protein BDY21DRAFT_369790 [Lineolata rhizophorae]|uniref:SWI5-dependent HO expression protein 3 n=1 Tax=Lineolata rhizophorae TaxID=578093 RepID=A0A6A6P768_9PEZI|nr:hypothetical protein BDY21DRAFT_369790 [Lineolata rhizophorae]
MGGRVETPGLWDRDAALNAPDPPSENHDFLKGRRRSSKANSLTGHDSTGASPRSHSPSAAAAFLGNTNGAADPSLDFFAGVAGTSPVNGQRGPAMMALSNGQTAMTGKSSKVIEKITGDNDRLKRELASERAAKEELAREVKASKALHEQLQARNANLESANNTTDLMIARRDRKLADVTDQLAHESARRQAAERRESDMSSELGAVSSNAKAEVARAREQAEFHKTAYAALQGELDKMGAALRKMQADIDILNEDRQRRARDLLRMQVVQEQLRQEDERKAGALREMNGRLEDIKAEKEEAEAELRLAKEEMFETKDAMVQICDKMKWTMNLHNMRNEG